MNVQTASRELRRFLFLVASARRNGNSEQLARRAAMALPAGSVEQHWVCLADLPLSPFVDHRHETGLFPEPVGNERLLLEETLAATDLVFVVPLYWYSIPASAKLYLDYWSAWLRHARCAFAERMQGKTLWLVCASSSDDQNHVAPLLDALRLTAGYLGMHWGGVLMGCGNRPGDVFNDDSTGPLADAFFATAVGANVPCSKVVGDRMEAA